MKLRLLTLAVIMASFGIFSSECLADPLPSVFGQQLGSAPSYPECIKDRPNDDYYSTLQNNTCFQRQGDEVILVFTEDKIPVIIQDPYTHINTITLLMVNGNVEGIKASTTKSNHAIRERAEHGSDYLPIDGDKDGMIIDALKAKFGEPSSVSKKSYFDEDEARYMPKPRNSVGHVAEWHLQGYSVIFYIDSGKLYIETDRLKSFRNRTETPNQQTYTPL